MASPPCPHCDHARRLHALVMADDLDAAIEAGLATYAPCRACASPDPAMADALAKAQARLRDAWAARDRYRQRNARLARRVAERDARRAPAPPAPTQAAAQAPALPSAAADILARAKAKAAERMKR